MGIGREKVERRKQVGGPAAMSAKAPKAGPLQWAGFQEKDTLPRSALYFPLSE
jgi:hypothetical protein